MKFIDQLERNKHILLLYNNNQKYAYRVIGRYIQNGFAKGEACIFYTSDTPEIVEKHLSAEGIDVSLYKQKNMLRIHQVERSDDSKQNLPNALNRIREEYPKDMKLHYRRVGGHITDLQSIDGMKLSISLEETGHQHFDKYNYSQICYYDVSKIENTRKAEWISSLLRNHHYVIYASEPDKAVAFETALLERDFDNQNANDNFPVKT